MLPNLTNQYISYSIAVFSANEIRTFSYGYMSLIWKWNPQTTFQYQFHYTPLNSNALGGHEPDLCYKIADHCWPAGQFWVAWLRLEWQNVFFFQMKQFFPWCPPHRSESSIMFKIRFEVSKREAISNLEKCCKYDAISIYNWTDKWLWKLAGRGENIC